MQRIEGVQPVRCRFALGGVDEMLVDVGPLRYMIEEGSREGSCSLLSVVDGFGKKLKARECACNEHALVIV